MRIERTLEIACMPEQLWPWIEEPEKQKQWMEGLLSNEATSDGPTRPGSTFRLRLKEGGKIADYDGRITAYDPPHHMAVALSGGSMKSIEMHADYRLEALGDGRTRLHYTSTADTERAGVLMRALMPLFGFFAKAQLNRFLRTLQRLAEAEAQGAASAS